MWGSRGHVCVEEGVGGRATVFTVGPVYTQKGVVGIQRRGWGKGCALPGGGGEVASRVVGRELFIKSPSDWIEVKGGGRQHVGESGLQA